MTDSTLSTPVPLIDMRGITTRFGRHVVHRDLDLQVREGEVLSLVGSSGSGKTTLLRQMMALDTPTRGEILLRGRPLASFSDEELLQQRRRTGVLFQKGALFSALSVFDNIALPLRELKCFDEGLIGDAVMLRLRMVGLAPADAARMPADLSGGMIKRAALARALALEPQVLFLDEPTAGLDPQSSDDFVALLAELHRALRLTVIMITHDLDTLVALSDRIAVLADQRVIACAPLTDIVRHPHPFIRSYFLAARGRQALAGAPLPDGPPQET